MTKVSSRIKLILEKHEISQNIIRELGVMIENMTLTELVREAGFAANVYPIKTEGDRVVLLQPQAMLDCAIAMFDYLQTGTQWQVFFNLASNIRSRRYTVMCACCANYRYGLNAPCEDSESPEYKLWIEELKELLINNLVQVCREQGIKKVYMRKASYIYENYGIDKEKFDLFVIEADEIAKSQKYNYKWEKIESAWDFIDWKKTTFKLSGGRDED